jgi:hypothetical protein
MKAIIPTFVDETNAAEPKAFLSGLAATFSCIDVG